MTYDAIVLGAGIAGLSVARELAQRKQRVLVLEPEEKGGVTSRAAAGILDPYSEAKEDTAVFRLGLKALEIYPSFLQGMGGGTPARVEYEKIGVLYLAVQPEDEELLKDRFEWQKKRGLAVEWLSGEKVRKMEPAVSSKTQSAVFYPEIPKLSAEKLINLLFDATRSAGVEIRTGVKKVSVWLHEKTAEKGDRSLFNQAKKDLSPFSGKVKGVRVGGESIESPQVVLASGCWAGLENLGIHLKISAVRGQILILRRSPAFSPTHILHTLRWAYVVPWPANRLLVGSTFETNVGFENRVTPKAKEDILNRAREIYEEIRSLPLERSWAGLRPYADGGAPLIGPTRIKGLFLALGYYRSGILIGPLVGKLVAEGITSGKFSPLLEPFYPKGGSL